MLEIRKILVPVDFSERSKAAAQHAARIGELFGAEVLFLHVVPHGPYEHGLFQAGYNVGAVWPDAEDIETTVADQLTAFINEVAPSGRTFAQVSWGGAAEKIKETAEQEQVDLIVMPTHGYGPFRRFLLGSVTSKTLHDMAFPVMTGTHVEKLPKGGAGAYKTVACAVDLAPHSEVVLRWARDFAQSAKAQLHVIHAAPPIEGLPGEPDTLPQDLPQQLAAFREQEVRDLLGRNAVTAETHVACEDVESYVPATAEDIGADVLIVGRSADTSVFGRLRSHSASLIRESPCPVVSV
jgi:nucleotide-binding universal stress UspA family protein